MKIELSIITINYNGLTDTCALIDTIPSDGTVEVIVVDNGSKEDEASAIEQRYPYVKVVRSNRNLGFAGGNNLGLQAATGRYLFFINNDTVFNIKCQKSNVNELLQPLIDRLESSPQIGMVCPKIRFAWEPQPIQFAGYTKLSAITLRNRAIGFGESDKGQYDNPHPTPYAHGAAMLVKREMIDKVGMMPECYFLYYEELDWSMMFTRMGYQIWYDPSATIFHKESSTTGADSALKTYYITRNRLLFARRNIKGITRFATYSYLTLIVALRDIIRQLLRHRPDLSRATLRGLLDFWAGKTGFCHQASFI